MKEYYLAKGEEKAGPYSLVEMKVQVIYADSLIWKEGWPDWKKAIEVPELKEYINGSPPPIKVKEEELKDESQPLLERVYTSIGRQIDNLLEKNKQKIRTHKFYTYLDQLRNLYKKLSEKKQRALSFFISILLVFLLSSLIASSFSWGFSFTKYWIAFVALNQIRAILKWIYTGVEIMILFSMFFLPKALKRPIARFAKNVSLVILSYFFAWIISPIYLIYRVAILFIKSERKSNKNEILVEKHVDTIMPNS